VEEYRERRKDERDGPQEDGDPVRHGWSATYVNYAEDCEIEGREHARETRIDNRLHESIFGF
jgi:hypothetical protein